MPPLVRYTSSSCSFVDRRSSCYIVVVEVVGYLVVYFQSIHLCHLTSLGEGVSHVLCFLSIVIIFYLKLIQRSRSWSCACRQRMSWKSWQIRKTLLVPSDTKLCTGFRLVYLYLIFEQIERKKLRSCTSRLHTSCKCWKILYRR